MDSIKRLPQSDRPRERLMDHGGAALTDSELVALLFGGDLACARGVVDALGGAGGLGRAGARELTRLRGVGEARACQLLAAAELGKRSVGGRPPHGTRLSSPVAVAGVLSELALLEQEEVHVLALDARHRLCGRFVVARGALNVVHVSPRDVFRPLVRGGAAATIVAHNHPSGDPAPSADDLDLTRRLRAAGDLLGVPLIDHLVISSGGWHSFATETRGYARGAPRGDTPHAAKSPAR